MWVLSSKNHLPKHRPYTHASPMPLAVPLPWVSQSFCNQALAHQSLRESSRAGIAGAFKEEEWGDRQKMVGVLKYLAYSMAE